MNILDRINDYYSKKCNRKNEVIKECTLLAPEIFRILRSKYPYLGDIRILNFGWIFRVVVKYKDNSDWYTYIFPSVDIDEFEDYPEIVAFNNKLKAYMDWDHEMDIMLYHEIKDNYLYLDRFLYKYGYIYNVCSHLYMGDKYLVLCTNGNDYITIDCIERKIVNIQSYEELNAEMLGEKWEKINSFDWDNLKRI